MPLRVSAKLRRAPHFVRQTIERLRFERISDESTNSTTFHFCYFTCASYFSYLYCSLHSLSELGNSCKIVVIIFCQDTDIFTAEQRAAIERLVPQARILSWPKSQGWGSQEIGNIWDAYALVAETAAEGDYIARIDSDVFFFSDWLLPIIARSGKEFVGDGHFVAFRYAQGGCYFIRVSAARRVQALISASPLEGILSRDNIIVEDVAAWHLMRMVRARIWLIWIMMFPDEWLKAKSRLGRYQRWKFASLHFTDKNKAGMLRAYEDQVLKPADRVDYYAALALADSARQDQTAAIG